jgi:mono/diheme cytochrome c family protein
MRISVRMYALTALLVAACGAKDVIPSAPEHPANPAGPTAMRAEDKDAIAAAETAAFERARPVFEQRCATCHTSAGAKASAETLTHFSMDTYPFGGHHATTIGAEVREVLGVTGEPPTMPKDAPGSVKGDELEAIVAWSKAFEASHAAGLHHHGDGGHGAHGDGAAEPTEHQHGEPSEPTEHQHGGGGHEGHH